MKTVVDKASSRGYFNHGWLKTHHTFSFANYYNPSRMHFGVLRVLNDDSVDPEMGFDTHPSPEYGSHFYPPEGVSETWRQRKKHPDNHTRRYPGYEYGERYLPQ